MKLIFRSNGYPVSFTNFKKILLKKYLDWLQARKDVILLAANKTGSFGSCHSLARSK